MAIALRSGGSQHGALPTSGGTITLPLTSAAGDLLVLAVCQSGVSGFTPSGGSGTWALATDGNAIGPESAIYYLYNMSSGSTTITITYTGTSGTYSLGQFSGAPTSSPLLTATTQEYGSSVATCTTASESYSAGNLLVASTGVYQSGDSPTWSATTWSNTSTTASLGANTGASVRSAAADFIIPTGAGSTTATYAWTGVSSTCNAQIAVFGSAPTGPENHIDMVM